MNAHLKEEFFKLEQELELADAEIAKLKAENERLEKEVKRLRAFCGEGKQVDK